MRTTIELPDELMTRAKVKAAQEGISLKELFVSAVEQQVTEMERKRVRKPPPCVGDPAGPRMAELTPEQIEEAMIPIEPNLRG